MITNGCRISVLPAMMVVLLQLAGCATGGERTSAVDSPNQQAAAGVSATAAESASGDESIGNAATTADPVAAAPARTAAEGGSPGDDVAAGTVRPAAADAVGETTLPEEAPTAEALAKLEEAWGVKVLGVRLSAAGHLLDFRYRVTDPEKAAPLFHRKTKPHLIDEASGTKLAVPNPPKVGPLRAMNKPEANRNYFVLFSNPGAYLKKGSKVTIVIGDFRAEHVVVE